LNPAEVAAGQTLTFELRPEHFPVGMRTPAMTAVSVEVALVRRTGSDMTPATCIAVLDFAAELAVELTLDVVPPPTPPATPVFYGALHAEHTPEGGTALTAPLTVTLTIATAQVIASGFGDDDDRLDPTLLEDIVFVVHYVLAPLP
jgi:hypothetical protein